MVDVFSGPHTALYGRIFSEFQEMPGLRLTLDQGSRLWGVEPAELDIVLQELVDAGILRQIGPYYLRADLGRFTA